MESGDHEARNNSGEGQLPSCDGCRVRKLKCSREKPLCINCSRLDIPCTYDSTRGKPGLKRGTIDKLTRRIDVVERILFSPDKDNTAGSRSATRGSQVHGQDHDYEQGKANATALSLLSQEISKLSNNISALSPVLATLGASETGPQTYRKPAKHEHRLPNGKRQRLDVEEAQSPRYGIAAAVVDEASDASTRFLTGHNLEALLDAYFNNIQPWLPNVHQASFRRKISLPNGIEANALVLHGMLVAALRFVDPVVHGQPLDCVRAAVEQSKSKVLLTSMTDLSVDRLQSLTMIAFAHIAGGEPMKAWPIVASLTRTVDFLQLSVEEHSEESPKAFLRPPALPPPADWVEEEERRRVFWNIFILDRICNVTTGWNIGLTADNVSQRLPINGTNWTDENPALAPFFGMWDKSAAKIGNSVAFLPAHYPSPGQSSEGNGGQHDAPWGQSSARPQGAPMDMSTIGAFAYYVESLESLCRINIYFLQQHIDFSNRQQVSNWLTRFKELDLRLLENVLAAKVEGPQRPREITTTALDPNMTLAHITHNTSMILLHQRIAYPEPKLKSIKLPNFHSAETCQSAAIETTLSTVKYLTHAPPNMPLSPHFAFCVYVSARVLLVHCHYYGFNLDLQFWTLLDCLQQMSRRWIGFSRTESSTILPAQFATHLQYLCQRYCNEPNFSVGAVGPIDVPSLSKLETGESLPQGPELGTKHPLGVNGFPASNMPSAQTGEMAAVPRLGQSPAHAANGAPVIGGVATSEENGMANWQSPSNVSETWATSSSKGPDDLANIISAITDQRFMDMDRVIAFDDFSFGYMPASLSQGPLATAGASERTRDTLPVPPASGNSR